MGVTVRMSNYAGQHVQIGRSPDRAMALTLQDLVAMPELKLELHTAGPDLDRAVTWVHVSELVDPTPFLTGGELLLTTGLAFGPDTIGADTVRAADGGPPGYVE